MTEMIQTEMREGEDYTFVAQPKLANLDLLILEDVTDWSLRITRIGADALDVHELLNQSPTIANFELSTAQVTNVSANAGTTGNATFTRSSGSWVTDLYFVGATVTAAGFTNGATNATWTITAVTALTITVSDPNDDITTEAAGSGKSITLTSDEDGARSPSRLINDKLWQFGGDNPGHSFQYLLDWSALTTPLVGGRRYKFEWEFDCRTAGFGKRYLVANVLVEALHSV